MGESQKLEKDVDQVLDSALDLKNFHKLSREKVIVPILVPTEYSKTTSSVLSIFPYDPKDETVVQHFIRQLITDQSLNCHLINCNLYKIFLDVCDDMGIQDEISVMEADEGSDFLLEQLQAFATPYAFVEKMQYSPHRQGDVLLLTGVGDVFPFMRIHALLEALQPYFSDIPVLLMYPGTYDQSALRLFDLLTPNGYYRAFNAV